MNVESIKQIIESKPNLSTALGMEFISTPEDDTCMARMKVDERNRQPFGFLSGGASLALAENVPRVLQCFNTVVRHDDPVHPSSLPSAVVCGLLSQRIIDDFFLRL